MNPNYDKLTTKQYVVGTIVSIIYGLVMGFCLFFPHNAFSNSVGFTYTDAIGDIGFGLHGDYEVDINAITKFGIEGQLQSGDAYLGDLDFGLTFGNDALGIRFESHNNLTGFDLKGLGRTNSLGASLVFPLGDWEVSGGIFGQSGNPFDPVYELKDPTDPTSAVVKDAGIRVKDGSTLNLALRTELEFEFFGRDVEAGLRGLFEIAGEGERVNQGTIDLETGGHLSGGFNWTAQLEFVVQAQGDIIQSQRSFILGANYPF